MKSLSFIFITLFSGAIAGTALAIINFAIVEPYIDSAIEIENTNAAAEGEMIDPMEFSSYRIWQKGGQIAAGTILGISLASLFGIVFLFTRKAIHLSDNKKKALVLAGIIWLVIFFIPSLKYPANPPAVGNPETIYQRQSLYIAFLATSGLVSAGLAIAYRTLKIKSRNLKLVFPTIYAIAMAASFAVFPDNPDKISPPQDLVNGFRIASTFTMALFWVILGVVFGYLWEKLRPYEAEELPTMK